MDSLPTESSHTKPPAGMNSLPCDVVTDILALLLPRDLAAARCVCKAWRATVDAGGLLRADLLPLTVGGVFTHLPNEMLPPQFLWRPSSPKVSGDLEYVGIDSHYGITLPRIADCCNGLLLLNNCVVNPATRRWARLPPCPPLPEGRGRKHGYLLYNDGYLLFDPTVSPHYQVVRLPYLLSIEQLKKKFAEGQLVEWPPSPWIVQVFSSRTHRWEDRSIVREVEGIAIPDLLELSLQQPMVIPCYSAYWHGSLYMHFEEGYLVRLTLSDENYQVIKTPALVGINRRENGILRIGKSKGGVYCAFTCEYQLRVWFLAEFGAETEWILVHDTNLVAIEKHVCRNIDHRAYGPWILQNCYRKEDWTTEEGVLEWDFDSDNIPNVDIQDVDTRAYEGAYVPIIGFHPYKEVIFLHLNECYAVAYHWNSSKVQYMSRKLWTSTYDQDADSHFIYSPCWTGDLAEEN
ncbi:unnamed protein product [Urochloa decumbens]|uniref:F-box domain-containing protein n=1 Tax=Urochloa decumbens TaxID=240449 RepID=A0ABC9GD12_9POAL